MYVKKLQMRIVKAQKEGRISKVKIFAVDADPLVLCQSIGSKTGDGEFRQEHIRRRP
jgi:hypothetical protein